MTSPLFDLEKVAADPNALQGNAILERIMADVERIQRDKKAERKTLSKLTGMTIHELDADLTAPDPKAEATETE